MKIIKEKNGTAVTMSLQGRLDTATAPQMEAELKKDMEEVTRLILDMRELEYLSSAGLRVILNAQKMMGKRGGAWWSAMSMKQLWKCLN